MCIAILNTKGTTLKRTILNNCWENNGDGAGILYIDNNKKLGVFKEMNSFDNFYNNYIDIKQKYGSRNIVLHFRISTHGRINETNCHPFLTNDEVGFVHNGMIYNAPTSTEFSDTYMFNEEILKNLKPGFEYNPNVLDMIEGYIGAGSKLIFLNTEDNFFIVNETAGHWHLGCWFSNTSYQQVNTWVDYGGTRKQKGSSYKPGFVWGSGNNWGYASKQAAHTTAKTHDECVDCGWILKTDKEKSSGVCAFCVQENQYMLDEQAIDCEICDSEVAESFIPDLNAAACKTCKDSLGV